MLLMLIAQDIGNNGSLIEDIVLGPVSINVLLNIRLMFCGDIRIADYALLNIIQVYGSGSDATYSFSANFSFFLSFQFRRSPIFK